MPRIGKADVYRQIEGAAQAIKEADKAQDGIVSRADMAQTVQENQAIRDLVVETAKSDVFARHAAPLVGDMADTQNALIEVFYRFIDHRDHKPGARITAKDIDRAVEYAKEKLVAAYDVNNNGLSNDEISQMKTIGQLSASLVKQARQLEKVEAQIGQRLDEFTNQTDALASSVAAGNWDAVYEMFDPEVRKTQADLGIGRDQFILEALLAPGSGVTSLDQIKSVDFVMEALVPFGPDAAQLGGVAQLKDGSTAQLAVLLNDRLDEPLAFTSAVG